MESSKQGQVRIQQKAATRHALLQAARRCFEQKGFGATTISEITRTAHVAHGTFYVHFRSKEALMDQLLQELNLEFVELLRPQLARLDVQSLHETVKTVVELFIDHWQSRAAFVESLLQRVASGLDRTSIEQGVNQPMLQLLTAALLRYAAEPGRGPGGAGEPAPRAAASGAVHWELVAHGILAMALRIALQYLFSDSVTRSQAVDTIVRLTLGAMGRPSC